MSVGAGITLLLEIEDSGTPGTFNLVGGLRSKSLSIKCDGIDKTNHGSAQWKELLDGAGTRSVSISGSGIFQDAATEQQMITDCLAQNLRKFRVHDSSNSKYFEGTFKIVGMDHAAEYSKERTYSVSLESSGAVTYN
jgi:TP901-1 family phage major tail protein